MTESMERDPAPPPGLIAQKLRNSRDTLPGQRDALPPGSLPQRPAEPHADENREPSMPPAPPR